MYEIWEHSTLHRIEPVYIYTLFIECPIFLCQYFSTFIILSYDNFVASVRLTSNQMLRAGDQNSGYIFDRQTIDIFFDNFSIHLRDLLQHIIRSFKIKIKIGIECIATGGCGNIRLRSIIILYCVVMYYIEATAEHVVYIV